MDNNGLANKSPPSRGAWIEIQWGDTDELAKLQSPPSRGAWIEMIPSPATIKEGVVAPLAGGVD